MDGPSGAERRRANASFESKESPRRPGVLHAPMPCPNRYLPPGSLVEVTNRTMQGRRLLRPSKRFNEVFPGVLGRAQRLHGVEIIAAVCLSTHFHLLLRPRDGQHLAKVMEYFTGCLATKVPRAVGRPGVRPALHRDCGQRRGGGDGRPLAVPPLELGQGRPGDVLDRLARRRVGDGAHGRLDDARWRPLVRRPEGARGADARRRRRLSTSPSRRR